MTRPQTPLASETGTDLDAPDDAAGGLVWKGVAVLVAFVGLFAFWGSTASLDAAVVSSGEVVVAGSRKAVQHEDGGIVRTIGVAEGDFVELGDVLISLEPGERAATENVYSSRLVSLRALEARLIAEREGADAVAPPQWSFDLTARDERELAAALAAQAGEFEARRANRLGRAEVLGEEAAQIESRIEGLASQLDATRRQRSLVADQLAGLRELFDDGLVPATRIRELEASVAGLDGDEGRLIADIAAARSSIAEIQLERLQLDRELSQEVAEEMRLVQSEIFEIEPRLAEARDALARTEIRATATGTVVGLNVFTEGGVIAPGEKLLEIVPMEQELVILARVRPADVDELRLGLPAEVRLDVAARRRLPIVHGEVRLIGADRLIEPQTGEGYFRAEVHVPADELARASEFVGETVFIRPGMPAEVVVPTQSRTTLEYLLEPLLATLWRSFREG